MQILCDISHMYNEIETNSFADWEFWWWYIFPDDAYHGFIHSDNPYSDSLAF